MKIKCQCIKMPDGKYMVEQTLSLTKGRAIAALEVYQYDGNTEGHFKPWKHWYGKGYRCEKVTLVGGWK